MRLSLAALLSLLASPALAQGVVPGVLSTNVDQNGRPLAGALLYVYANNTTTPQTCYSDIGLTQPMPNPVPADNTGRLPLFYCASGQVHIRLTDAAGRLVYDYPGALVIGASGGGGGGGGGVDPSTVMSTGDIKFRMTGETLTGWVKLNGTTIGAAASGATQRANADTQALYVYLWNQCAHCAVSGGKGSTGLADFQANKQLAVPDWRDLTPVGLDDMGATAKGGILASNITSGGGDSPTTPGAMGGNANTTLAQANLPAIAPSGSVSSSATTGIFGTLVPSGSVAMGGSVTPSGSVSIFGTLTPSGTVGIFGTATYTPAGTVSVSTPTGSLSGTTTFSNLINSGSGPTASVNVTGSSFNRNNFTVDASTFTFTGNTQTTSFTGSGVDLSGYVGGNFTGSSVAANTQVGANFSGSAINGSSFSASFTGTPVAASSQVGATTSVSSSFVGNTLGSATAFSNMPPFILGTYFMKL